jgi:hypothetical protein
MLALCLLAASASVPPPAAAWTPAPGPLRTRWTADVTPDAPRNEYPRPLLVRDEWRSLDGLWEYAVRPRTDGAAFPARADGQILVPFPLESQLSGVGRSLTTAEELVYRRRVDMPADFAAEGARTRLHFGAVDWQARVGVNGRTVGTHEGGFDPFWFDVTDALRPGANEIVVVAWDPTDAGTQPRGKQVHQPEGIFYTPVSGIWQTVWLERVPAVRVETLVARADRAAGEIEVALEIAGSAAAATVEITAPDGSVAARVEIAPPGPAVRPRVRLAGVRPWCPEDPALYGIAVTLRDAAGAVRDRVRSYTAFRDVALVRAGDGPPRIALNGTPYFMIGLLDQGWWPDGLYTPPTPEAMRHDLLVTRACGFNTIRKHVKVEPAAWYAACDRLGILVWQDMPSGDRGIGPADPDLVRAPASAAAYERELEAMIRALAPHPSIVLWVPFNEGWGQFDSARITERVRALDPTRLVTTASGWTDRGTGDTLDVHDYAPRLAGHVPATTGGRAWVIGECGGFGLPLPGHVWRETGWGYTTFKDCEALTRAYEALARDLRDLRAEGLSAAIYTQTTDVETEVNGLMTYDRDAIKMNAARVAAANALLARAPVGYAPPVVVVPTALDARRAGRDAPEWRMTTAAPPEGWTAPHFDASAWTVARGGFGRAGTPGTEGVIGTPWTGGAIWLRRNVVFPPSLPLPTHLVIHHDEDATVWLDGAKIADLPGYTLGYTRVPLPAEVLRSLAHGTHVLAIHGRQTAGGQFMDAGLCAVPSYTPAP